jgi:YegS/Rv2252/BmrU family lipid kinase
MAEHRLKIILNPISRPVKILLYLKPAIEILEQSGYTVDIHKSAHFGDAEIEARKAARSGKYELLVAAGGDGTYNQVINGIVGTDMPLALMPLGTSNVLMRSLKFPLNPVEAARVIVEGQVKKWDMGQVNGRYFAIMASFGLDAYATERTNLTLKRLTGKLAYIWAAIQNLPVYRPYPMTLKIDGQTLPHRPIFVNVANAPLYGGEYKLTPNAQMDDGKLDVFIFDSQNIYRLLYFALRVILHFPLNLPEIFITRARQVEITAPGLVPYQVDGDAMGTAPAAISIHPKAIKIITPQKYIRKNETLPALAINKIRLVENLLGTKHKRRT